MSPLGKSSRSTRVLIATFQPDQATVVEVKADIERLFRSLVDPEHASQSIQDEQ